MYEKDRRGNDKNALQAASGLQSKSVGSIRKVSGRIGRGSIGIGFFGILMCFLQQLLRHAKIELLHRFQCGRNAAPKDPIRQLIFFHFHHPPTLYSIYLA